ncbi:M36 family metallopeptidase [bacterium]|nr:M36 family metallopeptidase [bacterium]
MAFQIRSLPLVLVLLLGFSSFGHAASVIRRFPSGLLRHYTADRESALSVDDFMRTEFERYAPDFEWRQLSTIEDHQHRHIQYGLYHQGNRVVDRLLKVHFNKEGFVEFASSNWRMLYSLPPQLQGRTTDVRESLLRDFQTRYGFVPGLLQLDPVVWTNREEDRVVPAFEVVLVSNKAGVFRRFFVTQNTGVVLQERRVLRRLARKVYPVNPDYSAETSETLPALDNAATTLESDYFHIRREQYNSGTINVREINPQVEFFDDPDFSLGSDTSYDPLCTGTSSECPNQGFDGLNLYYHLESYRQRLAGYFTDLGSSLDLPADPLPVLVNTLGLDIDGDGSGLDESNNAAYINVPCREDEPDKTHCLVFWRPATINSPTCGGSAIFYDVAREALVAVHEYQHYVTDSITGMVSGQDSYNVGDALHEGYSDYFAATHVSQEIGSDVTAVGAYAFKNCPAIQRDIATLKVYDTSEADGSGDPHLFGWSWASGLWNLRTEFGATVIDKLALKSLFLLPTEPGYVDAVETLVEADESLYDGIHAARIRELYYDEIQFVGGTTPVFRDASRTVLELGLRSCGYVPAASAPVNPAATSALFALWAWATLLLGRGRRWQ